MSLRHLNVTDFRCFAEAEFEADPHYNLIYGANASGKTSLLEAVAYLGRGKSFRGASTQDLIRHGCTEFVLLGKIDTGTRIATLGAKNSRNGLEVRLDGESGGGAAILAGTLPLLAVDPEVHNLVAGGPDERRRYLDWIAFHVEQGYVDTWRRFRRALKQRNAALREGADSETIASWDREFVTTARAVHRTRARIAEMAGDVFAETGADLLGGPASFEYRQGWAADRSLEEALVSGRARDQELGSSQSGPHRGDLRLSLDERQARKIVSRGQQKLLACALILTAAELAQNKLERPLLLLLDDPAAELDSDSLNRLMAHVIGLGCQVMATALAPDTRLFPGPPALFHVERGVLRKEA